ATAVAAMTGCKDQIYTSISGNVATYARLYRLYMDLHDSFGKLDRQPDLHGLMKELLAIRDEARLG
ncbi:MAG: ribulokinase, partial [Chlorobia bacterium]|nr:ribulokinase [Fimbriimonadaceae bacterium]